ELAALWASLSGNIHGSHGALLGVSGLGLGLCYQQRPSPPILPYMEHIGVKGHSPIPGVNVTAKALDRQHMPGRLHGVAAGHEQGITLSLVTSHNVHADGFAVAGWRVGKVVLGNHRLTHPD